MLGLHSHVVVPGCPLRQGMSAMALLVPTIPPSLPCCSRRSHTTLLVLDTSKPCGFFIPCPLFLITCPSLMRPETRWATHLLTLGGTVSSMKGESRPISHFVCGSLHFGENWGPQSPGPPLDLSLLPQGDGSPESWEVQAAW